MRRAVILVLLLAGMEIVLPLGAEQQGSEVLLAFGFLILAAYTFGELGTAVGLPKIVGYLIAGVVFGPSVLGTVGADAADQLTPVSQLAVALIAFLAGAELRWEEVRLRGVGYLKIMGAELTLCFAALVAFLLLFQGFIPFLQGIPTSHVIAFSVLFASVAIVHSPAVTMALITETGSRGPVTRTTLGVVLISDVAVVVFFSLAFVLARALVPPGADAPAMSVGLVLWEITGALLVGSLLGAGVALYLRFVQRELMLFAVLVAFFGLEIARFAHTEMLLTLLTAGFVTENFSRGGEGEALRHAMERSAAPVFVVFFALSGAKIEVGAVAAMLFLVIPLAMIRGGAIFVGTNLGSRWAGVSDVERRYTWMGLISQAGVAIGLAAVVAEAYPEAGAALRTLLLSLIAVNETVGPILFRRALDRSGEVGEAGHEAAAPASSPAVAPAPGG